MTAPTCVSVAIPMSFQPLQLTIQISHQGPSSIHNDKVEIRVKITRFSTASVRYSTPPIAPGPAPPPPINLGNYGTRRGELQIFISRMTEIFDGPRTIVEAVEVWGGGVGRARLRWVQKPIDNLRSCPVPIKV